MHRVSAFLLLLSIAFHPASATEEKNIVPSVLRSAMVYRTGAELVHTATATLPQGSSELIIGDISNAVDLNNLRVSCTNDVTVMSVTFSTEYLKPETVSPFVKKLQDSMEFIRKELARLDVLTRSDNELLELLAANKSIGGKDGLSVAELTKMVDYYKQKTVELRTELNTYSERSDKWKQLIGRLENQIKEEEKKNSKTSGRLILQLMSPTEGAANFTISYLTTAASWYPFYDLKVNKVNDPLQILYKARLQQTTGLDWKKVKLSLSTSLPNQGGNAPVLKAWFLQFIEPAMRTVTGYYQQNFKSSGFAGNNSVANALTGQVSGLSLSEVAVSPVKIRGAATIGNQQPLYILNGVPASAEEVSKIDPNAIASMDVLKDAAATTLYGARAAAGVVIVTTKNEMNDYVSVNDNQMDVTFDIDMPYDVPANGKEQDVVLRDIKAPCSYEYYSAPRIDKEAYLLGNVPGWEALHLLPGEANIIVEGTNIGKSFIDPNSTLDTLSLTLGRDKRIVVKKEKIADYSSVKFLGSNKKQVFTYEITVRNNRKEKVQMLLKDQHPISTDKEIEEELLESSGAAVNKDTGVLTWRLELSPGETRKYRVSYSVKYPKDRNININ